MQNSLADKGAKQYDEEGTAKQSFLLSPTSQIVLWSSRFAEAVIA